VKNLIFTCLVLLLQVLIVTADEELLKSLREANRLLEQVRTHKQHGCYGSTDNISK
jgi:hypothetical protein